MRDAIYRIYLQAGQRGLEFIESMIDEEKIARRSVIEQGYKSLDKDTLGPKMSGWNRWIEWAKEHNAPSFEPSLTDVTRYIDHRSKERPYAGSGTYQLMK